MKRLLSWMIAFFFVILIILSSLLGTFFDDYFYHFGYEQNGVYEKLDYDFTWKVTENFQGYLMDDAQLELFNQDQAAHLADVKALYKTGRSLCILLFILISVLMVSMGLYEERRLLFAQTMKRTAFLLLGAVVFLALLATQWEWFFTTFHELLFTGNWQFHPATLMIKLWGENFFPLAALYVFLKNVAVAGICYGAGLLLQREKE
jgi:uncharacterized membrane protein